MPILVPLVVSERLLMLARIKQARSFIDKAKLDKFNKLDNEDLYVINKVDKARIKSPFN